MNHVTKACVLTTVHQAYDGRIYHKQCKSLVKGGYDVTLIAPRPETIKNDGIKIIPIEKPKKEWKRILQSVKIVKTALRTKADIYHFHDPELIPAGVLIKLLSGKPVIFDVHEHYPNAIMSKAYLRKSIKIPIRIIYEVIEKISLPFLSGIIYTTKEIGERYKKYKSCKIENYPPLSLFKVSDLNSKDESLLLYLGGITEIRGIRQLIQGFALVAKQNPKARLVFVGGFESRSFEQEIYDLVNELGLENHMQFHGKVPYEEIQKYMAAASIGIIPYLPEPNHLVCLPNKLFEYMASGIAVVASDFPHYREVIENSDAGQLIDPTKPESIAEGILKLMENQSQTVLKQQKGKAMFRDVYNWEQEEKKLLKFYNELISNH
ncbi:glycosyltransferase family 4 protein [Cytobacillus firmus]